MVESDRLDDSTGECSASTDDRSSALRSYLSLVPRGMQGVVQELLQKSLSPQYTLNICFRGEDSVLAQQQLVLFDADPSETKTKNDNNNNNKSAILVEHIQELLTKKYQKQQAKGKSKPYTIQSNCCRQPIGTYSLPSKAGPLDKKGNHAQRHVSVGYRHCLTHQQKPNSTIKTTTTTIPDYESLETIWTIPGEHSGVVWVEFETTAPLSLLMTRLRFLGPILALQSLWEADSPKDWNIGPQCSLEHVTTQIHKLVTQQTPTTAVPYNVLDVWYQAVQKTWNLTSDQCSQVHDKLVGRDTLRYRLSCLRDDSKRYSYPRRQLVTAIADSVTTFLARNNTISVTVSNDDDKTLSRQSLNPQKWKVDLEHYDLEIVILVRPQALAIGVALGPYQQLKARSFASGSVPSDLHLPILSGQQLVDVTRLRPSNAQLLLHLAECKEGDVVLDPCAGIGTIPLETQFLANEKHQSVVALGGDMVLTPNGLGPLARMYTDKVRGVLQSHRKKTGAYSADLMAWDAGWLPLRAGCVDAIVSDLPFGQQCMTASKVDGLIPLLVAELGRVLRSGGRMVLLCGSFIPILNALHAANECDDSTEFNRVWEFPCKTVMPVNIGGLQSWVIVVCRGQRIVQRRSNHQERVRRLTGKRERLSAHLRGKTRRVQK